MISLASPERNPETPDRSVRISAFRAGNHRPARAPRMPLGAWRVRDRYIRETRLWWATCRISSIAPISTMRSPLKTGQNQWFPCLKRFHAWCIPFDLLDHMMNLRAGMFKRIRLDHIIRAGIFFAWHLLGLDRAQTDRGSLCRAPSRGFLGFHRPQTHGNSIHGGIATCFKQQWNVEHQNICCGTGDKRRAILRQPTDAQSVRSGSKAVGSTEMIARSASRETAPSTIASGNAAPIGATAAPPAAYRRCTAASASQTAHPASRNICAVVDFPIPIDPVRPSLKLIAGPPRVSALSTSGRRPNQRSKRRHRLMQQHAQPINGDTSRSFGRDQKFGLQVGHRPDQSQQHRFAQPVQWYAHRGFADHPQGRGVHHQRRLFENISRLHPINDCQRVYQSHPPAFQHGRGCGL